MGCLCLSLVFEMAIRSGRTVEALLYFGLPVVETAVQEESRTTKKKGKAVERPHAHKSTVEMLGEIESLAEEIKKRTTGKR